MDKETCFSCGLKHTSVEASGLWYCPNALCGGCGATWFRDKLDSFFDNEDGTHSVDEMEWLQKGRVYNKLNKIKIFEFKR